MKEKEKDQTHWGKINTQKNECPAKDKDGNCLVPGVYSDSDEIGGG